MIDQLHQPDYTFEQQQIQILHHNKRAQKHAIVSGLEKSNT